MASPCSALGSKSFTSNAMFVPVNGPWLSPCWANDERPLATCRQPKRLTRQGSDEASEPRPQAFGEQATLRRQCMIDGALQTEAVTISDTPMIVRNRSGNTLKGIPTPYTYEALVRRACGAHSSPPWNMRPGGAVIGRMPCALVSEAREGWPCTVLLSRCSQRNNIPWQCGRMGRGLLDVNHCQCVEQPGGRCVGELQRSRSARRRMELSESRPQGRLPGACASRQSLQPRRVPCCPRSRRTVRLSSSKRVISLRHHITRQSSPQHAPKGMRNQETRCLLRSSVKLSRNAGTAVEPLAAL